MGIVTNVAKFFGYDLTIRKTKSTCINDSRFDDSKLRINIGSGNWGGRRLG